MAVEKVVTACDCHPERSRGISKMAPICDLEILRSALNDQRSSLSMASRRYTRVYKAVFIIFVQSYSNILINDVDN